MLGISGRAKRGVFGAAAALTLTLSAAGAWAQTAPKWIVDPAKSKLGFETQAMGAPVEGDFGRWDADIHFDPKQLAGSKVVVTIQTGSAVTGDPVWIVTTTLDRASCLGSNRTSASQCWKAPWTGSPMAWLSNPTLEWAWSTIHFGASCADAPVAAKASAASAPKTPRRARSEIPNITILLSSLACAALRSGLRDDP